MKCLIIYFAILVSASAYPNEFINVPARPLADINSSTPTIASLAPDDTFDKNPANFSDFQGIIQVWSGLQDIDSIHLNLGTAADVAQGNNSLTSSEGPSQNYPRDLTNTANVKRSSLSEIGEILENIIYGMAEIARFGGFFSMFLPFSVANVMNGYVIPGFVYSVATVLFILSFLTVSALTFFVDHIKGVILRHINTYCSCRNAKAAVHEMNYFPARVLILCL